MTFKNRLMLATRASGGFDPPGPGRNGRGPRRPPPSDRRPGPVPGVRAPVPGWWIRMDRNAAMASSRSASRCSSSIVGSWDPRLAARPRRNRTSVWSGWSRARGFRISRASAKRFTLDQRPRGIDARVGGQDRRKASFETGRQRTRLRLTRSNIRQGTRRWQEQAASDCVAEGGKYRNPQSRHRLPAVHPPA